MSKKDAPEYVYMFRIFFFLKKNIFDPKKRKKLEKIGHYSINVKIRGIFAFFRVKNDFFYKIKESFEHVKSNCTYQILESLY